MLFVEVQTTDRQEADLQLDGKINSKTSKHYKELSAPNPRQRRLIGKKTIGSQSVWAQMAALLDDKSIEGCTNFPKNTKAMSKF